MDYFYERDVQCKVMPLAAKILLIQKSSLITNTHISPKISLNNGKV